jgi:molybdate transport system ATP-binding protein
MLEVALRHRLGAFTLDAHFAAGGRLTALFGRSGAGKTTILKAIAGLIGPEEGRIVIDGRTLLDTARGIALPVHRRRIGYVFQDARLFPHLSVRQNLRYGQRFAAAEDRRDRFDEIVALLGLGELLARPPHGLSGGETQRVAIGRALLSRPSLLLLDEPLAALDAERKAEILPYIERLRDEAGVPIVYVSHSIAEVARLATTMVLVAGGRIAAVGPVGEVMGRPDLAPMMGRFAAGSVLETRVARQDEEGGLTLLACGAGTLRVLRLDLPAGALVRLHVLARDVMLATERPRGISALNILAGTVVEAVPEDGTVDIRLALAGEPPQSLLARITRRSATDLALAPGRPVFAILKTVAITGGDEPASVSDA